MAAETQPTPTRKPAPVAIRRRAVRARQARIRLARKDGAEFCRLILKDEETGAPIRNAPYHDEWHRDMDEHDRMVMWGHVESGKLLPLDEVIATPEGWRSIGSLRTGDQVLGGDGRPCRVTGLSPIEPSPSLYRLTFDDGATIVACADHQWKTKTIDDYRLDPPSSIHSGDGSPCQCGCGLLAKKGRRFIHGHHGRKVRTPDGWRIVTTEEILRRGLYRVAGARKKDGTRQREHRWRMPLPGPAHYSHRDDLAIHPYALGFWLGDGQRGAASVTVHQDDIAAVERCAALVGGSCPPDPDRRRPHVLRVSLGPPTNTRSNDGFKAKLRYLGVLNDKHIPDRYLVADVEQRRELLAGVLDSDGYCGPGGRIEFTNTNERLARQLLELVRSLGFKATWGEGRATIYGRDSGPKYRVGFSARVPVFWLERKRLAQVLGEPTGRISYRCVERIDPVVSTPGRCISVDSPDHTYIAGRDYVVTHNTQQVSIGRILFELGNNPELRTVIISGTASMATKIGSSIKQTIEESDELHEVFPGLEPSGRKWTENAFTVRRRSRAKDPSVQCTGLYGMIYGARIDRLVLDDVLRWENVQTLADRVNAERWLLSTLWGRLTKRAKVWWLGNAWHPEDAMHNIAKNPRWHAKRYPVLDDKGRSVWPEQWSMERIEAFKIDPGPLEYARQLMCQAQDESTRRCKDEWIALCKLEGEDVPMLHSLNVLDRNVCPEGCFTVTGVDLASKKKTATAKTVIFTILVYPNEDRQILCVDSGKFSAPEIRDKVIDHHDRYGSTVFVEDNGVQGWMLEMIGEKRAIPVLPFSTGMNKWHPSYGVESVFIDFANAKWVIPSRDAVPLSQEQSRWTSVRCCVPPSSPRRRRSRSFPGSRTWPRRCSDVTWTSCSNWTLGGRTWPERCSSASAARWRSSGSS